MKQLWVRSFGSIRIWICDPRSHRSRCIKERSFRACLHGGGGPQVGEVTRLAVVEK